MSIEDNRYLIRRKVFALLGAKFHVYDGRNNLIGFSAQKAFKLKEDIRFFADESMQEERLSIQLGQVRRGIDSLGLDVDSRVPS